MTGVERATTLARLAAGPVEYRLERRGDATVLVLHGGHTRAGIALGEEVFALITGSAADREAVFESTWASPRGWCCCTCRAVPSICRAGAAVEHDGPAVGFIGTAARLTRTQPDRAGRRQTDAAAGLTRSPLTAIRPRSTLPTRQADRGGVGPTTLFAGRRRLRADRVAHPAVPTG
jgi:hypothetical protein